MAISLYDLKGTRAVEYARGELADFWLTKSITATENATAHKPPSFT